MNKEMLKRMADAMFNYELLGYKFVDLPWTVKEEISNLTKPIERENFYVKDEVLVGSGEQSFLQLSLTRQLPLGKYYGITPCFRSEDNIDMTHALYFMKVELFQSDETSLEALGNMIRDAESYFNIWIKTNKILTDDGFDLVTLKNTEIGSYGSRTFDGFKYLYGTGLAEPRFSTILKEQL